jgi:8-oxo-dGTP diphosphatase
MKIVNYVAGFMFSPDLQRVALIRKQKPKWQEGKLNGIGGKVEVNEGAFVAIVREFAEETGCETQTGDWHHLVEMIGSDFRVDFFVTKGELSQLHSMEEEKVEMVSIDTIWPSRPDMIENLPWLISLAQDYLQDGRPASVTVRYP